MDKLRDTGKLIFVSGFIATVIQMLISWGAYFWGFIEQNPSIFHTRLLVNRMSYNVNELLIGILGNLIAGIAFATIIIFLLKITGVDYAIFKGGFIGIVNAMFQFYVLARLFSGPTAIIPDDRTIIHIYVVYFIWGILVAYIYKRYYQIN